MFFITLYSLLSGFIGTILFALQLKYFLLMPIEIHYLILPFLFTATLGAILGRLHDLHIDIFKKTENIYNELNECKEKLQEANREIKSLENIRRAVEVSKIENSMCNKCSKIIVINDALSSDS